MHNRTGLLLYDNTIDGRLLPLYIGRNPSGPNSSRI